MQPPNVIAEIGCNHKGDMAVALEMVQTVKEFCRGKYVKFQKRTPRECLTADEYDSPHPVPGNSYGATYGEHREKLEFTIGQHKALKDYCDSLGMVYSASVWDLTSTREVCALKPEFVKFGSACNTNFEMLAHVCGEFGGGIHISLGMTTHAEEDSIVEFLSKRGRAKDAVLYSCTSGYPVDDQDVCLLEIPRLRERFGGTVGAIGFSGHHNGIAIDVAAATLGATWIERHFTLNRTWKGTDHAASLEPDGLRRLIRDLRSVNDALRPKPQEILDVELPQRRKLKWNRKADAPRTA